VYSIAALLETDSSEPWHKIASACEYSGVTTHAIPHFSWQTAEQYAVDPLQDRLGTLTKTISPFCFHTSGLGIFSNDHKILFLIIIKTRALLELHELLWRELSGYAQEPRQYYSPENWIPHLSLNLRGLTDDQFTCSLTELSKNNPQFEFEVKRFGLLYVNGNTAGITASFPLTGQAK